LSITVSNGPTKSVLSGFKLCESVWNRYQVARPHCSFDMLFKIHKDKSEQKRKMANYVVEGGLNLWELLATNNVTETEQSDVCLLTGEKLGPNHVRMPCNHMFNYTGLVKELIALRTPNQYCSYRLPPKTLICPYCRQVSEGLLLHIDSEAGDTPIKNITTCTAARAIPHRQCEHVFKSGTSKGKNCQSKHAYYCDGAVMCVKHHRELERVSAAKKAKARIQSEASVKCCKLMRCKCVDLRKYLADHTEESPAGTKPALAMRIFNVIGSDDPSIMKAAIGSD